MMAEKAKPIRMTVKFYEGVVANVVIDLKKRADTAEIKTFDVTRESLDCETISIQMVYDFVTIIFEMNKPIQSCREN